MSNYDILKQSIQGKQQVWAEYNGFQRKMCPHILGKTNKINYCLFYQFAGGSESGLSKDLSKNWRCIRISELRNVAIYYGDWYSCNNYHIQQTCIKNIEFSV
jgi:hypothetical protein